MVAATAISIVAIHPSTFVFLPTINIPMMAIFDAMCIKVIIIGTATTPLITALHNKALIGSIPLNTKATPRRVAIEMMA